MSDERDAALAALLDRTAAAIGPSDTAGRLEEIERRGSKLRAARFSVVVGAVAIFATAVSWTGLALRDGEMIPADVADWRTFSSLEENGWTIQIPPPWSVQELPACPNAPERIGVIVTNTDFEFRNPRGDSPQCEDRFVFAGFPRDGVALAFMPVGVRTGDFFPSESVFPLEPEAMIDGGGIRGGPNERFSSIWLGDQHLAIVRRWVGPVASLRDVEALDQMLHSLTIAGSTPRWVDRSILGPGGVQVTFRVPSYWRSETFPAIEEEQDVFQPLARLATPEVEDGHCPGAPESMGFDNLGDGGTVIVVSDGAPALISREVGSRPNTLRPRDATEVITVHCGDEIRVLSFLFREDDRPILIQVAKARYALHDESEVLRYILDRIRVSDPSAG